MNFIYSKKQTNKILHIIYRMDDFNKIDEGGRINFIDAENFLQLSALKLKKDQTFDPHFHIWKSGEKKVIAQESWVVLKGSVKCKFYDIYSKILFEDILNVGDCSVTLEGGHNYEILEEKTMVYEFKTGPYKGQINDKVIINEV